MGLLELESDPVVDEEEEEVEEQEVGEVGGLGTELEDSVSELLCSSDTLGGGSLTERGWVGLGLGLGLGWRLRSRRRT